MEQHVGLESLGIPRHSCPIVPRATEAVIVGASQPPRDRVEMAPTIPFLSGALTPRSRSTYGCGRTACYLGGAYKPTIKRFADLDGPDFMRPTRSSTTNALTGTLGSALVVMALCLAC